MTELATTEEQLDVGHGAIGTPVALDIPEGVSFDEWDDIGKFVLRITNASAWWIGDWLFYGEFAYGEKYDKAIAATDLDEKTLREYSWVSGKVEMSVRTDTLSWSHHKTVAALPKQRQQQLLELAARKGWSVRQLREHIDGKQNTPKPGPIVATIVRLQIPTDKHDRWQTIATAHGHPTIEAWLYSLAEAAEAAA